MSDAKAGRIIVGVIGALYIAFIIVGFAKHEGQKHSQSYQQDAKANPGQGSTTQPTVIDVKPNAAPEANPCEQRDGENWQDLCQQWRMAEAAEDLTNLTLTQIGVTVAEIALLVAVLFYTAKATLANMEANRLTRQSFVAEQRPWLGLERIERVTPLVWDKENGEGNVAFRFILQNHGHSPAIHADIRTRIMARFATFHGDMFDDFSAWNRERPLGFGGSTIFPGRSFTTTEGVSISKEELDAYFLADGRDGWKERCHLNMVLVGSIQYKTTLDERTRFTDFVYMLMVKDGDAAKLIAPIDGDVPAEHIVLKDWPVRNDMIT